VLFDEIVTVYFIRKIYIYILALEMASPGSQHCANQHTFVPYGFDTCTEITVMPPRRVRSSMPQERRFQFPLETVHSAVTERLLSPAI